MGRSVVHPALARQARADAGALPDAVALEVDGGIHEQTARPAADAGANLLVAGSAVFESDDPGAAYSALAAAAAV